MILSPSLVILLPGWMSVNITVLSEKPFLQYIDIREDFLKGIFNDDQ